MAHDTRILNDLQELSGCLNDMSESFIKLIADARVPLDDVQPSTNLDASSGDLSDVNVERLVGQAHQALENVSRLNRAVMLGNSGGRLYERVRSSQKRLAKVHEKGSELLKGGEGTVVQDMRNLLATLEKHYYASPWRDELGAARAQTAGASGGLGASATEATGTAM